MEYSTVAGREADRTHIKRNITLFLFLLSFVTYLDRVNISIAGVPLSREFGFSPVQLGTIFSAFVLGYTLFQIPAGWVGDRFGHKRTLIGALLWWSLFTAFTGWAGRGFLAPMVGVIASFWLVRFLIGVGEAATYPCGYGMIAEWFDPTQRGSVTGLMYAGVGAGTALTPPLVAWIMVWWGWESAFYFSSLAGIVLALGFYLRIPGRSSSLERHRDSSASTVQIKSGYPKEVTLSGVVRDPFWKSLLRNRQIWLLTVGMILFGYIVYVYYFWLYLYLTEVRHLPLVRGSLAASLPFLAMAICAPAGGWLGDRLISRTGSAHRLVAMVGLICAAGFIPLGAGARNPHLAVAFLSLGAGSVYLSVSSYFVAALDLAPARSGTVTGVINMGANLGGVISPTLTPWIAGRYGWFLALCTAAVLSLVAAILWAFIKPCGAVRHIDRIQTMDN